jgi:class 3 adenylate cyclase/tetratricopeptide (TPR) repeat protein
MSDIESWLEKNGLGRHLERFIEAEIDIDLLPHLTDDDIEALGLPIGARRRLSVALAGEREPRVTRDVPEANPAGEVERRQLSIMFCDLVGSVELGERMDVEDYRALLSRFRQAVVEAIEKSNGFVARHQGDGVLAYFGYPIAQENDAERATRAALEVVRRVSLLDGPSGPHPNVRVGIATGPAVVGDVLSTSSSEHSEFAALGTTPNLAARLQGLARPNEVMVSETTWRLIEHHFEGEKRVDLSLKGISDHATAYVVDRLSRASSDTPLRRHSPLVGRGPELALLMDRWEKAKEGAGQVVTVSADPGVGKTRIVWEFRERLAQEELKAIVLQCSSYHSATPLYPVLEWIRSELPGDSSESSDVDFSAAIGRWSAQFTHAPEFSGLLGRAFALETQALELNVPPDEQRQRLLEALSGLTEHYQRETPLLLIAEDLHWADPTTIELLEGIVQRSREERSLLLLTFRPEFQTPWRNGPHFTQLPLTHLTRSEAAQLVEGLAGNQGLSPETVERIVVRTDGVPLFLEELWHSMGDVPDEALIPESLRDALMARLDRIGNAKRIAQFAAVLGRTFDHAALSASSPFAEAELEQGLRELSEAQLLFSSERRGQTRYEFKHALVRDTAYDSMLRETRWAYHRRIADTLPGQSSSGDGRVPNEVIAHHYTEAGDFARAVTYWEKAGDEALQRSANREAIQHLRRGLQHLKALSTSRERSEQELRLQVALGAGLMVVEGSGSPKVREAYVRARDLCQELKDDVQMAPVLWGLSRAHLIQGDFQAAQELGREFLTFSQSSADPIVALMANNALGTTLWFMGELSSAREHLQRGTELIEPDKERKLALQLGFAPGVSCRAYLSAALWVMGYPDQALCIVGEAIATGRQIEHLPSLANALFWAASLRLRRREPAECLRLMDELLAVESARNVNYYSTMGEFQRGWAIAALGEPDRGIRIMRKYFDGGISTQTRVARTTTLIFLADAYLSMGAIEEGLRALDEARADVQGSRHYHAAEVHRLAGDLYVAGTEPDVDAAQASYQEAIRLAQSQSARSFELRAAIRLARLWTSENKRSEAYRLLDTVYSWFEEGLNTPDLVEARALLSDLA